MTQAVEEPQEHNIHRDGLSQAERQLAALDPTYVLVDERSTRDLLAFAQKYAEDLNFFDVIDGELVIQNDWQAFFANVDLDEAIAYLETPEKFTPERAQPYTRPHFALYLTFLQLIHHTQNQLNGLTKRHLDFYYQRILQLSKRGSIPDQVNVLLALAPGIDRFALPAGTRLDAGTDSMGQSLVYQTDTDITVNQAQVAKLHTVFADRSTVGLADVWTNEALSDEEALIQLIEMAWGHPAPSDPLPGYPTEPGAAIIDPNNINNTIENLTTFFTLSDVIRSTLHLSFSDYQDLNTLRERFEQSSPDWHAINQILEKAGRVRSAAFQFDGINPKDFDLNLATALDLDVSFNEGKLNAPAMYQALFQGIPNVDTLYEAYDKRLDYRSKFIEGEFVEGELKKRLFLPVDSEFPVRSNDNDFPGAINLNQLEDQLNDNKVLGALRTHLTAKDMPLPQTITVRSLEDVEDTQWELFNEETTLVHIRVTKDDQGVFSFYDQLTFTTLMSYKLRLDNEWQTILEILSKARQIKLDSGASAILELQNKDFESFDDLVETALSTDIDNPEAITYPNAFPNVQIHNLADYEGRRQDIENYFYMGIADFHYFMDATQQILDADGNRSVTPEWETVFTLLDQAHKNKIYTQRRQNLQATREREGDQAGFDAMLYLALNIDNPQDTTDPLDLLEQYSLSEENLAFLAEMRSPDEPIPNDDDRWVKTYDIVERVQRIILPEPRPQIETWRNLHPLQDAKSAVVRLGDDNQAEAPRWQTFGQAQSTETGSLPTFGWAISSPILALSQGKRNITLTLGFDPDTFLETALKDLFSDPDNIPFRIEISTESGWMPVAMADPNANDYLAVGSYWNQINPDVPGEQALSGIQLKLGFPEDVDPIAALPIEENPFNSPWPILRLMMQDYNRGDIENPDYETPYLTFKELILQRVHIQVNASNLTPSHIQNDSGVLNSEKPFEPFGLRPTVGSRFYLGHPELVNKTVDSLNFTIQWLGWPDDIQTHYFNHKQASQITRNSAFKIGIDLINRGKAHTLRGSTSLFNPANVQFPAVADRLLDTMLSDTVKTWHRYIQWELRSPDFQHLSYPGQAAALSVNLAAAIAKNGEAVQEDTFADQFKINPPYTPTIKSLTLAYTSSLEINVSDYQSDKSIDHLYHIQPFGYSALQPDPIREGDTFLPQFDNEGELYIGIDKLGSAQTLSLLFQMAEGSADPDLPVEPIQWHYLSGNRWLSLEQGQLLEDGTRGLINSGIMRFKLNAVAPNTLLDPSLYWLRASIRRHSNSVCDTIDIHTQAVSATFVDQGNAPDHLSQPLPPETITKVVNPVPQIAEMIQPYPSFGGKMPEQDATFYTRISERLRHKNRAVAQWDYEHLILDRFPHIYKAKCLPATQDAPGEVTIVVIPDIRQNLLFDPFEPKVAANVIADIETYLAERIPTHATVFVKNAHYVPIKARFAVRFQPGTDEGFAKQQLNDELNRFLSPWAYDTGGDIVIGGRIYANTIINFIEERPYVDFVAAIRLFKSENGEDFTPIQRTGTKGYWVQPDDPTGVMVAARQHEIDIIAETDYDEDSFQGINYMRVELDFIVG